MNEGNKPKFRIIAKAAKRLLCLTAVVLVLAYTAYQTSPWPGALLIRWVFEKEAHSTAIALEKHLPTGISAQANLHYDPADKDAYLDVFYPSELETSDKALPTVVWIHGGGWLSGSKADIANYAKILAGKNFTVVGVDYSIAPGATYPTPIKQVNTALGYLERNAKRLHIDSSQFILAGDSGGAHIAAQVANSITVPTYAKALGIMPLIKRSQLNSLILFCGAYDVGRIHGAYDVGRIHLDGPFGSFLRTVLWSYSGNKNFIADPNFTTASVINYVTPEFPPAFISAGNADPLLPQSHAFAEVLASRKVQVDSLFFPHDYKPKLPHEYQFNLDTEAGQLAFKRLISFAINQTKAGR